MKTNPMFNPIVFHLKEMQRLVSLRKLTTSKRRVATKRLKQLQRSGTLAAIKLLEVFPDLAERLENERSVEWASVFE